MKEKKNYLIIIMVAMVIIVGYIARNYLTNVNTTCERVAVEEAVIDTQPEKAQIKQLDSTQIKNIYELSAIDCDFSNIAKILRGPDLRLSHEGEKLRMFWGKYRVKVRVFYDLNQIKMEKIDDEIILFLIAPKVTSPIRKAWNKDSYIIRKKKKKNDLDYRIKNGGGVG